MTKSRVASLLEKITRIIPGIAGYQDREKRRDADRSVREGAAAEVRRCRERLSETMNDLSRAGGTRNLRVIGRLERLATRLERTEDEIRYAAYGYAGWFDRAAISLEDLERLYEHDLLLLEAASGLPDLVGPPDSLGSGGDWSGKLEEALESLRRVFDGRRSVIEEEGAQ
ncbi:MAG: hypothetical protein JSV00_00640 [bacterium]|nr:MAG: hypothetical protein JSV00_00640 [bacterium]